MRKTAAVLFLLVSLFACKTNIQTANSITSTPTIQEDKVLAKNIILMIGDGMGIGQITAGMYATGNTLNLESFPVVGLQKTHAYNDLITDSAASATAIACGVKTYNGAIGVNKDTLPIKTIIEEAEENGLRTGLVATSTIVHATPASFIAHQPMRNMYEFIADDILESDIDLLIGGGLKYFNSQRMRGRSLLPKLRQRGFTISGISDAELVEVDLSRATKFAYFTANDAPIPSTTGRDYLPAASKIATRFLNNRRKKGFFLMIEGSQIDWGGHANDTEYIISEVQDFDRAIGEILDFAKENKETLVIVTADHETGGFAINPLSKRDSIIGAFTSKYHTATMVPVFAYGPGAELFNGIYDNTAIHQKMRQALGFDQKEEPPVINPE